MKETDYYSSLPKKQMGAGALFFSEDDELLIVHPVYKDRWEIPGGVVEDGESPREAAKREIQEELGLDIAVGRLLVCDYWHPLDGRPDNLMFIFYGGILTEEQVRSIKLEEKEIGSFEFIQYKSDDVREEISQRPRVGPRILHAFTAIAENKTFYLENAKLLDK
jgi:8-oxo-dGTP diphosphatase